MTILKNSQLGLVGVQANTTANKLEASQLGLISVSVPPVAASLDCSQMGAIILVNNNKTFVPMPPPIGLGCWTPCGVLAYNGE